VRDGHPRVAYRVTFLLAFSPSTSGPGGRVTPPPAAWLDEW